VHKAAPRYGPVKAHFKNVQINAPGDGSKVGSGNDIMVNERRWEDNPRANR
jgi:hypothetical protein